MRDKLDILDILDMFKKLDILPPFRFVPFAPIDVTGGRMINMALPILYLPVPLNRFTSRTPVLGRRKYLL